MTPKHAQVLEKLAKLAERHEPGTRLPTIRALMKPFRVSQATIEPCLDELIRRGLADLLRELDLPLVTTHPLPVLTH